MEKPFSYSSQGARLIESTQVNDVVNINIKSQSFMVCRQGKVLNVNENIDNDNVNNNNNNNNNNYTDNTNISTNTSNNDSGNNNSVNKVSYSNISGNVIYSEGNNSDIICKSNNNPENRNSSSIDFSNTSYLMNWPNSSVVLIPSINLQSTAPAGKAPEEVLAEAVPRRPARRERTVMLTPEQRQYNLLIQQRNVYLSGFPSEFRPTMFRRLCEVYGRIDSSKLAMTSDTPSLCRGYGFVLFTFAESAKKCIEALNGVILNGRPIQARRADLSAGPISVYAQSNVQTNLKQTTICEPSTSLSTIAVPLNSAPLNMRSNVLKTYPVNAQDAKQQTLSTIPALTPTNIISYEQVRHEQEQLEQRQVNVGEQMRRLTLSQYPVSMVRTPLLTQQHQEQQQQQQQQQQHQQEQTSASLLQSALTKLSAPLLPLIMKTENCNSSVLGSLPSYTVSNDVNKSTNSEAHRPNWSLLSLPSSATDSTKTQLYNVDANDNSSSITTNEPASCYIRTNNNLPLTMNVAFTTTDGNTVYTIPTSSSTSTSLLSSEEPSTLSTAAYNQMLQQVANANIPTFAASGSYCNYIPALSQPQPTSSIGAHLSATAQPHPVYLLYSPQGNNSDNTNKLTMENVPGSRQMVNFVANAQQQEQQQKQILLSQVRPVTLSEQLKQSQQSQQPQYSQLQQPLYFTPQPQEREQSDIE